MKGFNGSLYIQLFETIMMNSMDTSTLSMTSRVQSQNFSCNNTPDESPKCVL